jgi:hypothetical protein
MTLKINDGAGLMVFRCLILFTYNMLRKDYIMKMIEDFVRTLAKVIMNREMKNYVEAKDELDNLSTLISGFGLQHIKSLGAEGVAYVLGMNKESEAEKIYCTARILKEDGMIYEEEGNAEDSLKSYNLSLELFKLASTKEFDEKGESLQEIEFLKNKLTEKYITG